MSSEDLGRKPTMNDIAHEAKVSISTVSRVINDGYASRHVRDRVRHVIERRGYVPDYNPIGIQRTELSGPNELPLPTIKDIARIAGVSIASVSRVINNKGPISPAMRGLVEKVVEELNFVPNLHGQMMGSSGRSISRGSRKK